MRQKGYFKLFSFFLFVPLFINITTLILVYKLITRRFLIFFGIFLYNANNNQCIKVYYAAYNRAKLSVHTTPSSLQLAGIHLQSAPNLETVLHPSHHRTGHNSRQNCTSMTTRPNYINPSNTYTAIAL